MGATITTPPLKQIFPLPNPMTGATGSEGSITFPNGFIMQWGYTAYTSINQTITFPVPFPNAVFMVVLTAYDIAAAVAVSVHAMTLNDFIARAASPVNDYCWIAVGR